MDKLANVIAQKFVRAINRQDTEALAELMTPDHRFIDSLGTAVKGRDKMRAGWAAYFRIVPDYTIGIEDTFCDGPVVAMIGSAQGTYAPQGELKAENRWVTPSAFRALNADCKIAAWLVYTDNEPMRQRMVMSG